MGLAGPDKIWLGGPVVGQSNLLKVAAVSEPIAEAWVSYTSFHAAIARCVGQMRIEADGGRLVIRSGRSKFTMPMSTDASPSVESVNAIIDLPRTRVLELLQFAVRGADAGALDWRANVQLTRHGGDLRAVASDGARLFLIASPCPLEIPELLVPASVVKLLGSLKGEVLTVGRAGNQLTFSDEATTVYASKPAAQFPNIDSVLPKAFDLKVELDAKEFLSAVESVTHVATADPDQYKSDFTLAFADEVLTVKGTHEVESAEVELPYSQLVPDAFDEQPNASVRLNPRGLADFLGQVAGTVEMALAPNKGPVMLSCGNKTFLTVRKI